jgi:hypothetical protein
MKARFLDVFDRLVGRALPRFPLHRTMDSFNVEEVAFLRAAFESAEHYETQLITEPKFETGLDLLTEGMKLTTPGGLILEFGVATGRTIRHLGSLTKSPIYGLDSFEGLPEAWRSGFDK